MLLWEEVFLLIKLWNILLNFIMIHILPQSEIHLSNNFCRNMTSFYMESAEKYVERCVGLSMANETGNL